MRLRILSAVIVVLIAVLAALAWNRNTPPAETAAGAGDGASAPPGGTVMVDPAAPAQDPGVTWQAPSRWVEELAGSMRLATYVIPAPATGGEAARCAVYYFGPGQGGGTEANIERWIGEFESRGKPARRNFEVHGLKVSKVEVTGTYLAHGGPTEAASGAATGWTLLGAIVEGPSGPLFFKLTGPTATASAAAKEFEGLLASLRKK